MVVSQCFNPIKDYSKSGSVVFLTSSIHGKGIFLKFELLELIEIKSNFFVCFF